MKQKETDKNVVNKNTKEGERLQDKGKLMMMSGEAVTVRTSAQFNVARDLSRSIAQASGCVDVTHREL